MTADWNADFCGLTVLITGGSRGIGSALARGFARSGASVVIGARDGERCQQVAAEIDAAGGKAVGTTLHLGDTQSVRQFVATAATHFGGVDVVVNNAATGLAEPIGSLTEGAWEKVFAVNLRGPVFLVEAAMPHLLESKAPSVLNVISPGAFMAAPTWAMYAASKAALLSFTRSTAAALGPNGIRVNAICPGPVETEIFRSNPSEVRDRLAAATALRRVAQPDEMVGPALFLSSSAASYITGEVLVVAGGESGS
jgi:NAD(P)-dependent dehydrogenase (short-subunit alcohol dehydrogenase family)